MSNPRGYGEELEQAGSLYRSGRFADAADAYFKAVQIMPESYDACSRLGELALLSNRLGEAESWLTKAIGVAPESEKAKILLAEVFYRRDEFQKATPLLRDTGREEKARKLESFAGVLPYEIRSPVEVAALRFVVKDPLPLVELQVNNSEPVIFLIDTGGAELILDKDFAREIGATEFGSQMGTFAGGMRAAFHHGRIDTLRLGEFTVRNIPVSIIETRRFSQIFGGKQIDGIVGTVPLYHFIPTLDYRGEQLILRRKTTENLLHLEQEEMKKGSIVVPFWMAGDHYMHAWGTVNGSEPMLFFVDTGLAGGGFTCPESTLKKASVRLEEDKAEEGIGGGGRVRVVPFTVRELTLGEAKEHNIRGSYSGGLNEYAQGFHCGGLISHAFFRNYVFTIDFDHMRYFLRRG